MYEVYVCTSLINVPELNSHKDERRNIWEERRKILKERVWNERREEKDERRGKRGEDRVKIWKEREERWQKRQDERWEENQERKKGQRWEGKVLRGEEKYESSVQQLTEGKMVTVPLNRHRSFKPHIIISVSVAPQMFAASENLEERWTHLNPIRSLFTSIQGFLQLSKMITDSEQHLFCNAFCVHA